MLNVEPWRDVRPFEEVGHLSKFRMGPKDGGSVTFFERVGPHRAKILNGNNTGLIVLFKPDLEVEVIKE